MVSWVKMCLSLSAYASDGVLNKSLIFKFLQYSSSQTLIFPPSQTLPFTPTQSLPFTPLQTLPLTPSQTISLSTTSANARGLGCEAPSIPLSFHLHHPQRVELGLGGEGRGGLRLGTSLPGNIPFWAAGSGSTNEKAYPALMGIRLERRGML